jgi:hypothetical protein
MPVHVSIHDVSPANEGPVREALELCHRRGIAPALLVVPDFHGRARLSQHPEFCAGLRELQASGHEIFLHGFFHRSRPADQGEYGGRPGRLYWLYAQRLMSNGEAEFADLTREEAAERLDAGEAELKAAGLRIDGFVPPAWGMQEWLIPILAGRGYRYCEGRLTIYDPQAGRARKSVVLNYASRTPARVWSSVAWCRLARPARALFPARVALHPGDLGVPLLRRELEGLLDWARPDAVARAPELFAADRLR